MTQDTIKINHKDTPTENLNSVSLIVSPSDSLLRIKAYRLIGNQIAKKKITMNKYITCLFNAFASLRLHYKDTKQYSYFITFSKLFSIFFKVKRRKNYSGKALA